MIDPLAAHIAAQYTRISSGGVPYRSWVREFPNVNQTSFAAMQQYADHEGTEISDDPVESLKMIALDMGWSQTPLPTNKHHWVWELATALRVDIKKEHADGASSSDD